MSIKKSSISPGIGIARLRQPTGRPHGRIRGMEEVH